MPTTRARSRSPPRAPRWRSLDGGLLTTVQDGGRRGHRRLGVPWCGLLDPDAAHAANRAVGNPAGAALLECTATGPTLRFLRHHALRGRGGGSGRGSRACGSGALAGAERPRGRGANRQRPLDARPPRRGCARTSRSRAASTCPTSSDRARPTSWRGSAGTTGARSGPTTTSPRARPGGTGECRRRLRAAGAASGRIPRRGRTPGRHVHGRGAGTARERGLRGERRCPIASGCRLSGPVLAHRGAGEILTDGMVPGCIQVPPGRPADRGPRRRSDHRRLSEDRDGGERRPGPPGPARRRRPRPLPPGDDRGGTADAVERGMTLRPRGGARSRRVGRPPARARRLGRGRPVSGAAVSSRPKGRRRCPTTSPPTFAAMPSSACPRDAAASSPCPP